MSDVRTSNMAVGNSTSDIQVASQVVVLHHHLGRYPRKARNREHAIAVLEKMLVRLNTEMQD